MCFSSPKAPDIATPPPVAPTPSPEPTSTPPDKSLNDRQRQVAMLKYGALSTVTNQGGAAGITGSGPDLYPTMTQGKQTTGGAA